MNYSVDGFVAFVKAQDPTKVIDNSHSGGNTPRHMDNGTVH